MTLPTNAADFSRGSFLAIAKPGQVFTDTSPGLAGEVGLSGPGEGQVFPVRFRVVVWTNLVAAITLASALAPAALAQDAPVVYRGATIETMGKAGRLEKATLVLRGGVIEAVGADVPIPETARVIDATGKTILPGWVDPYRVVNISSGGGEAETESRTIVINGRTFIIPVRRSITSTTFTRVADSFYPFDARDRALMRSGITRINMVTRGVGQSALARVTPEQPETMVFNPDGLLFASVTNQSASLNVIRAGLAPFARPSGPPGSSGGRPTGGFGFNRGGEGGRPPIGGSRSGPSGGSSPSPPTTSGSRELWQKVYEGQTPLVINTNNAATILHVMKLLQPFPNVRVALVATGGNIYQALDSLKGRKVTLVMRPTIDFIPYTRDRVCVPKLAQEAGLEVVFSLAMDEGELNVSQDAPLFPVACLVEAGLSRRTALEALTIRPAALLGIDKTHGTLEPQKSADILVFDGDPLDPASQLRQVLVDGESVYES